MKEYETVFVTRPDSAGSETEDLLKRVDGIIERHSGTILEKKNWGKRELAYMVERYNQGVYHYYDYTGDSAVVHEVERALKLNDLPMKYLTVLLAEEVDVEKRKREIAERKEEVVAKIVEVEEKVEIEEEVEDA